MNHATDHDDATSIGDEEAYNQLPTRMDFHQVGKLLFPGASNRALKKWLKENNYECMEIGHTHIYSRHQFKHLFGLTEQQDPISV